MRITPRTDKPLVWVSSSRDELIALPEPVRRAVGFALRFAQTGVTPDNVKPLRGFTGAGVLEVKVNYDGDAYRGVYTVKLAGVVYVLHCFQKKSKSGIAIPKATIDLIHQRYRAAELMHGYRDENQ